MRVGRLEMSATVKSVARVTLDLNYVIELVNRELSSKTLEVEESGEFRLPRVLRLEACLKDESGANPQVVFVGELDTPGGVAAVHYIDKPEPPDDLG